MPAEALNFMPDPVSIQAYKEQHPEVEIRLTQEPEMNANPGQAAVNMIWVKRSNSIEVVPVKLGDTDELYYEVLDGLQEGDRVLTALNTTGIQMQGAGMQESNGTSSPFMPQRPGGGNPPRSN